MAAPALAVVRSAIQAIRTTTLPDGRQIKYHSCMKGGVMIADTSRAELKVDFVEKPEVWHLALSDDAKLRKYLRSGVVDGKPPASMPSPSSQLISLGMALRDARELSLKLNGRDTNWGRSVRAYLHAVR